MVGARTQPLDSWIIIARMKRASTPVDEDTEVMALLMSLISVVVGLATLHCLQLFWMLSVLAVKLYIH